MGFKRELAIHLLAILLFGFIISLSKRWFALSYLPFWIGLGVGSVLPDLDHFIYMLFLHPEEVTSQRAKFLMESKNVRGVLDLVCDTQNERNQLVFHTALFQLVFIAVTFLVVSSSGNLIGRGIVLGFSLHLLVDEVRQLLSRGNLDSWFRQIPLSLDHDKYTLYVVGALLLLTFLAIFF